MHLRALYRRRPSYSRPAARKDLVYAVPNKGNADVLLNGDDMAASIVLFERGEVRSGQGHEPHRLRDKASHLSAVRQLAKRNCN